MQVKNLNTSSINYDINKAIYIRKIIKKDLAILLKFSNKVIQ